MASVFDVAKHILEKRGPMSAMKLQKLVYYSQAWHLVWKEAPLFGESIEAWKNGPVVRELYDAHRGLFTVEAGTLSTRATSALHADEVATVEKVLSFYGDKTAQWLSDLTHLEAPWVDARAELPPGAPSAAEISHASMHEYYSSI